MLEYEVKRCKEILVESDDNQWRAPLQISKFAEQFTPVTFITMVYEVQNYGIHGVYKPTNTTGGRHIVGLNKLSDFRQFRKNLQKLCLSSRFKPIDGQKKTICIFVYGNKGI